MNDITIANIIIILIITLYTPLVKYVLLCHNNYRVTNYNDYSRLNLNRLFSFIPRTVRRGRYTNITRFLLNLAVL